MVRPKGIKTRIDGELVKLRDRPREAEVGIEALPQSDREAICKTALNIDDDTQLKEIFAAADFDPANPFHWKKLVQLLAALRSQRSGAPLQWGPEELRQLMIDVDRLHKKYPKRSVQRLCETLKEENARYANPNIKASTLRRKFYDGFDEQKNGLLKNLADGRNEKDWLRNRRKAGWRAKGSVPIRELMRLEIIETIMTAWHKVERQRS